jgi:hypothetical protein
MKHKLKIPKDALYKSYDRSVAVYVGDPRHDKLVPLDPERCPAEVVEPEKVKFEGRSYQCKMRKSAIHSQGLCGRHAKMEATDGKA